jgi:hypothetical protein
VPPVRVQAPDGPEVPGLRPGAIPGSTYARPEIDNGESSSLLRMSQTLGELSPSLARFGQAYMVDRDRRQAEEVKALPLRSDKEVLDHYRANLRPGIDAPETVTNLAWRTEAGARAALQFQNAVSDEINKSPPDWEKVDIDAWLQERLKGYAEPFKGDRHAEAGFATSMSGFRQKLIELRAKNATGAFLERGNDVAYEAVALTIDKMTADGKTPAEIHDAVRSQYRSIAGPGGTVPHLRPGDMDKFLLQKVKTMVTEGKNLDVALNLLAQDRTDEEGRHIPALKNTAAHAGAVESIVHTAVKAQQKQVLLQARQAITDNDSRLLATGEVPLSSLSDIVIPRGNEDGSELVITADQRRTAAVRRFNDQGLSAREAKDSRESPLQTFNRELDRYALAGVDHPKWKAELEAGPKAASANELTDPKKLQTFLNRADLYDQLREKNKLYLNSITDPKTQLFYEGYRVAKSLPNVSKEQAADLARQQLDNPKQDDILKANGTYSKIAQQVSSADPTTWMGRLFGAERGLVNGGMVQAQVTERAEFFARLGLPPDRAVEEAQKAVKETSVNVNGWIIPKSIKLPGDGPATLASYMEDFAKKYGGTINPGIDKSTIGVVEKAGVFTLVGPNGVSLRDPVNGVARFTLKDLTAFQERKDSEQRSKTLEQAEASRGREAIFAHPVQTMLDNARTPAGPQRDAIRRRRAAEYEQEQKEAIEGYVRQSDQFREWAIDTFLKPRTGPLSTAPTTLERFRENNKKIIQEPVRQDILKSLGLDGTPPDPKKLNPRAGVINPPAMGIRG